MSSEAPPARPWTASKLDELFAIDRRSLAAFRIGLGLLLLWDLYGRSKTLRMHYTGEGAYPREIAAAMRPDSRLFHVFLWSDRVEVQALLFGVFALLALCLVVGYRTRLASVLSFVFLASLVRRNHWACHTGDVWLKALAFWAMFLPLGSHFSLDRLRSRRKPPEAVRVTTLATAGVLVQIGIFYLMAGLLKTRYDVWHRGEAVWIFSHVVEYTRPFGAWLGQFPGACRFMTYATLVLESGAPFALFFPFGTRRIRSVLFLLLAGFHSTLWATIHIGIFQVTCIAALTLILPGELWDGLARRVPRALRQPWGSLRAAARRSFGREQVLEAPAPGPLARAGGVACNTFLALVLAVVLASNLNSAIDDPYDKEDRGTIPIPGPIDDYGRMVSMVQFWNMFTDIDRLFFGWFLVLGQEEDGRVVDVLSGEPFREIAYPQHYARFFPNHNSRRYWRELAFPEREYLQKPMCDYLAREWQRAGRAPLTHLAILHIGRVPSQKLKRDQVRFVCADWEAPHEPLKAAPADVQQRWKELRESWSRFLQSLPKTVAPAG